MVLSARPHGPGEAFAVGSGIIQVPLNRAIPETPS
jgi:hypothetical protein